MAIRPWIEEESPSRALLPGPDRVKTPSKHSMWQHVGHRLHRLLGRDEPPGDNLPLPALPEPTANERLELTESGSTRKVGVGLPRMPTFRRQASEKRDRLEPVNLGTTERRATSATRPRALSAVRPRSKSSPPPSLPTRDSAPAITASGESNEPPRSSSDFEPSAEPETSASFLGDSGHDYSVFPRSRSRSSSAASFERLRNGDARSQLEAELDSKWILNLSMHFRDKSDREKFFVTYAETPTRWRRVTVSCDYRNAEPGSLEMDLKELQYQRDKSIQIYESIRDSLLEIQFYNTVTNLKLETSEGRLHVHVTEDVNEIIPYPPKTSVEHLLDDQTFRPREIRESELAFDSHISGFVYKVRHCGREYIKKEIPGPDTVDEFLYEINALHALTGSESVIQLEGIVVDDTRETVKGLLISFAEQGALVDLLYDHKGETTWNDRLRWARQAVQGLSEIHEEGYVQGDFTLSNIVIDGENNAKIIDINRRGCPVGWEPPEISKKIASNQRISMYIGEKSDLYQLGMTLWALAMDDDEPERHDPPLTDEDFPLEVPRWYTDIVMTCLQPQPRDRLSAKELLKSFPTPSVTPAPARPVLQARTSTTRAIDKRYIEPSAAVEREDIERLGPGRIHHIEDDNTTRESMVDPVFTDARSSSYQFESGSSYVGVTRGRRPGTNVAHLNMRPPGHQDSGLGDVDLTEMCEFDPQIVSISPNMDREYDEIELRGHPYLVSRSSFDANEIQILDGHTNGWRSAHNTLSRHDPTLLATNERASTNPFDFPRLFSEDDKDIDLESEQIQAQSALLAQSSIASGSTPRNSSSVLMNHAALMSRPQPLDLTTVDLVGFGAHVSPSEYSPHEPKKMRARYSLNSEYVSDSTSEPTIVGPNRTDNCNEHIPFSMSEQKETAKINTPGNQDEVSRKQTSLEMTELESAKVELTNPQMRTSEPVGLEPTKPERIEPKPTKLEAMKLETTELEPTVLESTVLESTKLRPTELEVRKPEVAKPEPTRLEPMRLEPTRLETTKPEPPTKPESRKPPTTQLQPTKPEATKLEPVEFQQTQPQPTQFRPIQLQPTQTRPMPLETIKFQPQQLQPQSHEPIEFQSNQRHPLPRETIQLQPEQLHPPAHEPIQLQPKQLHPLASEPIRIQPQHLHFLAHESIQLPSKQPPTLQLEPSQFRSTQLQSNQLSSTKLQPTLLPDHDEYDKPFNKPFTGNNLATNNDTRKIDDTMNTLRTRQSIPETAPSNPTPYDDTPKLIDTVQHIKTAQPKTENQSQTSPPPEPPPVWGASPAFAFAFKHDDDNDIATARAL